MAAPHLQNPRVAPPSRRSICLSTGLNSIPIPQHYSGLLGRLEAERVQRIQAGNNSHLTASNAAAAAAAASRPDLMDEKPQRPVPVQVTRPTLPCDKPLPLANVMEIQRLLYLLEAPEYCMRAFREHGVNGQDLLCMTEEDMEDGRFKFPKNVQRKVMRIGKAWRVFQSITGCPTMGGITMEQYVAHYGYGSKSPDAERQLEAAYKVVDANGNGFLTFEEFLVGFSLLDAAIAETRRAKMDPESASRSTGTGINWFNW